MRQQPVHDGLVADFFRSGEASARMVFGNNLENLPSTGRVLEIGCGKGRVVRYLAAQRAGAQFFGIDVSKEMIRLAWESDQNNLPRNLCFVVGDGSTFDAFPDQFFDVLYSYIVFQHLPRHIVRSYLRHAERILKPGGNLIFQVQTRSAVQEIDPADDDFRTIRYYTSVQARALVGPGFELRTTRGAPDDHNFFVEAVRK